MNKINNTAVVEYSKNLLDERLYFIQWMIARNLRDIPSRRAWLDEMSLEFANKGDIDFRYKDGSPYILPDLDYAFGEDDDMRWLSSYISCDGSNVSPRHKSNKIERLRIINIFLKLRYPQCRHLLTCDPQRQ